MKYFCIILLILNISILNCQTEYVRDGLHIKTFPTGFLASNCHIIYNECEGIIVDAGSDNPELYEFIRNNNLKIKYIFCTHSHIDHVLFSRELKLFTGATLALHRCDENHYKYYTQERIDRWMKSGEFNENQLFLIDIFKNIKYDTLLNGGECFSIGKLIVDIIHTPGHSKGSISILVNKKYLFVGDMIYSGNIGRTDIDSGSSDEMEQTINEIIMPLDEDIIVFPGHGNFDSLKNIKKYIYRF